VSFLKQKVSTLQQCERRVLSGDRPGPCPDVETQQHIDTLQLRMHERICKKCGGSDKACGGAPDRTTTEIGFGLPQCDGSRWRGMHRLRHRVQGRLSRRAFVPILKTYPPECNVAP
jgi:hypothetical protein